MPFRSHLEWMGYIHSLFSNVFTQNIITWNISIHFSIFKEVDVSKIILRSIPNPLKYHSVFFLHWRTFGLLGSSQSSKALFLSPRLDKLCKANVLVDNLASFHVSQIVAMNSCTSFSLICLFNSSRLFRTVNGYEIHPFHPRSSSGCFHVSWSGWWIWGNSGGDFWLVGSISNR